MKRPRSLTLSLVLIPLLTACGTDTAPTSSDRSDDGSPASVQAARPQPRLAVTYDGGVLVLDATDGTVIEDLPQPGFLRVSPAGDDRHVLVSGAGGFETLDLGSWSDDHGDHGHSWTTTPHLTGTRFPAEEPGHVVRHADRTVLFDDGTGKVVSFDPHDLTDGEPALRSWELPEAHHGVALELADGRLVHTVGDEETRTGVSVLGKDGTPVATSDDCPGVHGEAVAGHTAVFGCEDGVLLVDGRTFRKVDAPDDYARIGNTAATEHSPVVLGDYKVDPDAELERPTRVSLVDTRSGSLRLVDLGTSYTFRSLGRGPGGEGLVLGTDGALHVIDVKRGKVTRRIDVVVPWREPVDWQQPRPALLVLGSTAYVTEPASRELHVIDLDTGRVAASHELPKVPIELTGNQG